MCHAYRPRSQHTTRKRQKAADAGSFEKLPEASCEQWRLRHQMGHLPVGSICNTLGGTSNSKEHTAEELLISSCLICKLASHACTCSNILLHYRGITLAVSSSGLAVTGPMGRQGTGDWHGSMGIELSSGWPCSCALGSQSSRSHGEAYGDTSKGTCRDIFSYSVA